ncbi:hypothetical protein D350_02364 [Enterococcus faecalis VC1B-1]|nr:hypothetical protein HMPREF9520_01318 [Enterococcus faecalis TX1467]EPI28295.1 hypothetical protein D350_02364 [Enterococcus faecalis VC1B-1]
MCCKRAFPIMYRSSRLNFFYEEQVYEYLSSIIVFFDENKK